MNRFWSQAIYDETLQPSLVSFLEDAPRFYSEENELLKQTDCWDLYKVTYNLVLLTFLRLATHKESKVYDFKSSFYKNSYDNQYVLQECYISPLKFGNLIYDNFIFDVPKLMDLSALFGPTNSALLTKMFHNIFINQPKYKYDLEETGKSLKQVNLQNGLSFLKTKDNLGLYRSYF